MQQVYCPIVAFTSSYTGMSSVLANDVRIAEAFNPSSPPSQTPNVHSSLGYRRIKFRNHSKSH